MGVGTHGGTMGQERFDPARKERLASHQRRSTPEGLGRQFSRRFEQTPALTCGSLKGAPARELLPCVKCRFGSDTRDTGSQSSGCDPSGRVKRGRGPFTPRRTIDCRSVRASRRDTELSDGRIGQ